ncbi:hypothetical protein ABZ422_17135 [Micromonospora zamorensis]|uniref:hypothetical protein n=1 Tax=Micromonospora zamorensis TaxID=709883 RepID=UPI003406FEAF
MLYVLTYLEERGIDLEPPEFNAESEAINSAYGLTTLITPAPGLLDQLDPSAHRAEELIAHFEEMGVPHRWSVERRERGDRQTRRHPSGFRSSSDRAGRPSSGDSTLIQRTREQSRGDP